MKRGDCYCGFSLVEILVSLFVVCLVAVNISGLQKMIGDQNRDNFSRVAVIELVTEKLEQVMQAVDIKDVLALHGTTSRHTERGTVFSLTWNVGTVSGALALSPTREIAIKVTWADSTGAIQTFTYSELISLVMLLEGPGGSGGKDFSYLIPNLLSTTKVNYFEPKMDYKENSYVMYNSHLFHATSFHSIGNEQKIKRQPPINTDGVVASGWEKIGRIDNPDLAKLFTD